MHACIRFDRNLAAELLVVQMPSHTIASAILQAPEVGFSSQSSSVFLFWAGVWSALDGLGFDGPSGLSIDSGCVCGQSHDCLKTQWIRLHNHC